MMIKHHTGPFFEKQKPSISPPAFKLLYKYKIVKLKTINCNIDLAADLHACLTLAFKEEICIRTETHII